MLKDLKTVENMGPAKSTYHPFSQQLEPSKALLLLRPYQFIRGLKGGFLRGFCPFLRNFRSANFSVIFNSPLIMTQGRLCTMVAGHLAQTCQFVPTNTD